MKAFPLFFTLNIISLFSFNTAFNITEERLKDLDKMISSQIISAKLPTFGIIITNKTSTIFQNIYGENNEVTEKTPFIIGSVSKSFTALGVLKSGEDLNKKIRKFKRLYKRRCRKGYYRWRIIKSHKWIRILWIT